MSLIRKHVAVLQAWACLALVALCNVRLKMLYLQLQFGEKVETGKIFFLI